MREEDLFADNDREYILFFFARGLLLGKEFSYKDVDGVRLFSFCEKLEVFFKIDFNGVVVFVGEEAGDNESTFSK